MVERNKWSMLEREWEREREREREAGIYATTEGRNLYFLKDH